MRDVIAAEVPQERARLSEDNSAFSSYTGESDLPRGWANLNRQSGPNHNAKITLLSRRPQS
jgi:hypothetical protein